MTERENIFHAMEGYTFKNIGRMPALLFIADAEEETGRKLGEDAYTEDATRVLDFLKKVFCIKTLIQLRKMLPETLNDTS